MLPALARLSCWLTHFSLVDGKGAKNRTKTLNAYLAVCSLLVATEVYLLFSILPSLQLAIRTCLDKQTKTKQVVPGTGNPGSKAMSTFINLCASWNNLRNGIMNHNNLRNGFMSVRH